MRKFRHDEIDSLRGGLSRGYGDPDRVTSCLTRNFNGYWWLFFVDHKGVSSYIYIAPVKGARITKEEKSMCINFLKALGVHLCEKI